MSDKLTTIIVETGSRAIGNVSHNSRKPDAIGSFYPLKSPKALNANCGKANILRHRQGS